MATISPIPFGFDLDTLVPYASGDTFWIFTELLLSIVAWFGTTTILGILFFKNASYNTKFVTSLTLADFAFSTTLITLHIKHLIAGGWSSGKMGCIVSAGLSMTIVSVSVLSMVAISAERYLSIFYAVNLSNSHFMIILSGIWLAPLGVGPLTWLVNMDMIGDYILLQNGKSTCMANFGGRSFVGRFISCAYLVCLFLSIAWVVYAYVKIYVYYTRANRKKNKGANVKKAKLERELLIKCMSLSIVFLVCWIPFLLYTFYMLITGDQPSPTFTSLCATNSVLNSALNPMLLLVFDSRIRSEVVEVFSVPVAMASASTYGSKGVNSNPYRQEVKEVAPVPDTIKVIKAITGLE